MDDDHEPIGADGRSLTPRRFVLADRIVEIGLVDGVATVLETRDGRTVCHAVGAWFALNGQGAALRRARGAALGAEVPPLHETRPAKEAARSAAGARPWRWLRSLLRPRAEAA